MTTNRLQPGAHTFVCNALGYNFKSTALLTEALDASGNFATPSGETNQRLALVGDSAAALAQSLRWYPTDEPKVIGHNAIAGLTNAKLARIAGDIGLITVLTIERGMRLAVAARSGKMMATALEALLGAIYLDSGNDIAPIQDILERLGL
nr:hypothetical protein B0A51_14774 [Rachicladosporium sp. CCFEE 5018]